MRLDAINNQIDISHYVLQTKVLGPFLRSALWVHGCCFECPGCIAKKMNAQRPFLVNIDDLAQAFLKERQTEGITISGGEPFLQAEALSELLLKIKEQRDYGVILYTGFTIEELMQLADPNVERLIGLADVLIDGKYIRELDDGKAYRGSANQRIHLLTPRYQDEYERYYLDNDKRNIEINVTENNIYLVGVPSKAGLETWNQFRKKAGCESD